MSDWITSLLGWGLDAVIRMWLRLKKVAATTCSREVPPPKSREDVPISAFIFKCVVQPPPIKSKKIQRVQTPPQKTLLYFFRSFEDQHFFALGEKSGLGICILKTPKNHMLLWVRVNKHHCICLIQCLVLLNLLRSLRGTSGSNCHIGGEAQAVKVPGYCVGNMSCVACEN